MSVSEGGIEREREREGEREREREREREWVRDMSSVQLQKSVSFGIVFLPTHLYSCERVLVC